MNNVVSIISQKGGVGKSTVTTLLANIFFFHYKLKVAIIDADFPQVSIHKRRLEEYAFMKEKKRRENYYNSLYKDIKPYPIIATNLENCGRKITEIREDYDYIFVDVTGSLNQAGVYDFLMEVNHFYIPVLQDGYSVNSALEIYGIINDRIKLKSENYRGCKVFFNRVPKMNKVKSMTEDLSKKANFLEDYLSAYIFYERNYRSTLFPIPQNPGCKKEENASIKLFHFAESIKKSLEANNGNYGGVEIIAEPKPELV